MDFILNLAMQFWPMTVFIILVIIGFIINLFDKKIDNRVNFKYKEFPHMKPIPIATKGKGFWGALLLWSFTSRHWEVVNGYKYETLLLKNKKTIGIKTQKWMDETFRDINIEVNGFYFLNYLAYWALRLGGFVAWNKHRKVNAKIGD